MKIKTLIEKGITDNIVSTIAIFKFPKELRNEKIIKLEINEREVKFFKRNGLTVELPILYLDWFDENIVEESINVKFEKSIYSFELIKKVIKIAESLGYYEPEFWESDIEDMPLLITFGARELGVIVAPKLIGEEK